MRLRTGRGPLQWRRVPADLRYPRAGATQHGYGVAQAARRARIRRGLWWATGVATAIVLLCCAGIVVSQIGVSGTTRPTPGPSRGR